MGKKCVNMRKLIFWAGNELPLAFNRRLFGVLKVAPLSRVFGWVVVVVYSLLERQRVDKASSNWVHQNNEL